jgi:hypothetical protein
MPTHSHLRRPAALACGLFVLALAGCNGGGGSADTPPAKTDLSMNVIDGPISGALVCLDRNGNGACDADEPQARTDATGKATLSVANADLGKYPVVARVEVGAVDADHGAVTVAYTMSAPADQTAVISPLTTLVQQTVQTAGVSSAAAAASIQASTGLTTSPFADYTKTPAPSDGSLAPATLARLIVLTAQQQAAAVASAAGTQAVDGSTITAASLDRTVGAQLLTLLPAIVQAVADAGAQASGAALESALNSAASSVVAASALNAASAAVIVAAANPATQPSAAPAAGIQLRSLTFTDAANYFVRVLTFSLAQSTPDASNHTHYVDRRLRSTSGQLAKWGSGNDPWRNADLHWNGSTWAACALNFESASTVRDANGKSSYNYCDGIETGGSSRTTVDIGGQTMAAVYASLRGAGYTNITITDPTVLGSASFPSGSKIFYQIDTPVTEAIGYYPAGANNPAGSSSVVTQYSAAVAAGGQAASQPAGTACNASETNTAGSNSVSLEGLIAAKAGTPCIYAQGSFIYGGVTYTSGPSNEWWGNSTVGLGKLGTAPINSGPAPGFYTTNTWLRAAFTGSGSNPVTYYACKERFNNGSIRNCTVIGSGSYAITTLGGARALSFLNPPAMAAGLNYNRVFVERGGAVYSGYQSKPATVSSVRFNDTAGRALLTQLGLPAEEPSVPLALTAASYQGSWDARDANEASATVGTTVFFGANGSVSCQNRPSGSFEACTLTIDDPASGHFTLVGTQSGSTATGSFSFLAGTASGSYHDPTSTPVDGNFLAYRR